MFTTDKNKAKVFNKESLIAANKVALATGRNRALEPKALKGLRDDLIYPVIFSMIHNDVEMRVGIVIGDVDKPESVTMVFLDIPFGTYESLPVAERVS